jgi:predicted metal-dependent hydrolase
MQPKHLRSGEWLHRDQTREQIGQKLWDYYRAYATEEVPPRLLALIKQLDNKEPERPEGAPKSDA